MAWRGSGVRIPSAPLNFVARARQFYTIENMRDTSAIGNRTAGIVLAALLQAGQRPLLPFGDGHPYDIAFDDGGRLMRVQCKTGKLIKGASRHRSGAAVASTALTAVTSITSESIARTRSRFISCR